MVIFLAGMQDVPRQLLEAVEIDGGGFVGKAASCYDSYDDSYNFL